MEMALESGWNSKSPIPLSGGLSAVGFALMSVLPSDAPLRLRGQQQQGKKLLQRIRIA
jgi:hypothetical protein